MRLTLIITGIILFALVAYAELLADVQTSQHSPANSSPPGDVSSR